jgi:hypothetical protein
MSEAIDRRLLDVVTEDTAELFDRERKRHGRPA